MRFLWPESARADLRAIDRANAVRILQALSQLGETGEGHVRALSGKWQGYFRLRVGDYRALLQIAPEEITVVRVRHRSEAYR